MQIAKRLSNCYKNQTISKYFINIVRLNHIASLWDFETFPNLHSTNILSLRDYPVRDQILVENIESEPVSEITEKA